MSTVAVITGGSSGIGKSTALSLLNKGCTVYELSRRESEIPGINHISADITDENAVNDAINTVISREGKIDILINNAGFGAYGLSAEVPLETELNMIDLNIKAVHILTKLFLAEFEERNSGYIMNVASIAGFLSGPLMSTYYATKGYVLKFTTAIYEELRRKKSNVHICALCPGPVDTEFNNRAGVNFIINGHTGKFVADYAIKKMLRKKLLILPGGLIKAGAILQRLVPTKLLLKICYMLQSCKK